MPPEWEPTDPERKQIEAMAGYGVPQDDIACILNVDPKTLRKRCRRELDLGMAKANAKVAQTLFQQATSGVTSAAIFWTKVRMGWRERLDVELTGPNGGPIRVARPVRDMTRQEVLEALARENEEALDRAAIEVDLAEVAEPE